MIQITPQLLEQDRTATIRALSSLSKRDAAAVRATVRSTGNRFAVEEHDDYDGYLSLLLTPCHEGAAAFLVSGRVSAVDLAELHGDEMVCLGRFPSVGAAMLSLRPALERDDPAPSVRAQARSLLDRHGSDADIHAALRADRNDDDRWRAVIHAIDLRHDIS